MSEAAPWLMIETWVSRSSKFFVKKLARNDTSWADGFSNQAGPYVPAQVRGSDFFPSLLPHESIAHIRRAKVETFWPQTGELKLSSLSHYGNKGPETHLTVVPHSVFKQLTPASWLIGGRLQEPVGDCMYWFIAVDADSESAELLETNLDLPSTFVADFFDPSDLFSGLAVGEQELRELVAEIRVAVANRKVAQFLKAAELPPPGVLARSAQDHFLGNNGMSSLNPFELSNPGNAIMVISRDVEFEMYKRHERRFRAAQLAELLEPHSGDLAELVVRSFSGMYEIFLRTSQQRKSRAGLSFELHVARALRDGGIRFVEQIPIGSRRPDFLLPDRETVTKKNSNDGLVLSCKTTLKERWKQVTKEKFGSPVFLVTVDDRVATSSIDEMAKLQITLVVPESMKDAKDSRYEGHPNVISFKTLFEHQIKEKRPLLLIGQGTTGLNYDNTPSLF